MRIPNAEHRALHFRIDDIAADFALEDVWALPVTGNQSEFPEFLAIVLPQSTTKEPAGSEGESKLAGWLFALRFWLGRVFGWDREINRLPIPGCAETSLRDRLPAAERAELPPPSDSPLPFKLVYRDHREAFLELSNGTVHAAMHYSWAPDGDQYRARLAVYVKTRGWFGPLYLLAIAPFRRFIIYPAMLRQMDAKWRNQVRSH